MFRAIIFDMDGLLINSEPFWRRAQKEVFSTVGVELSETDMRTTMGRRIDEVVAHWHHERPWTDKSQTEIEAAIVTRVIELVRSEGAPMEGVMKTLELCKSLNMPLAIASSSSQEIINAVVDTLGIHDYFEELFSAEHETHGKPHPGVFITTAAHLQVKPEHCLVFEDSPSGVLAAKAAKMSCIAVPDNDHTDHPYIGIADIQLSSLSEFNIDTLNSIGT